jgi:predicted ATPase
VLDDMRNIPGKQVILTGGPSAGKSHLIKDFVKS